MSGISRHASIAFVFALSVPFAWYAREVIAQRSDAGPTPTVLPAPPDANELARRATVVARIGDYTITLAMVEAAIAKQSPIMHERFRDPAYTQAFVRDMVNVELLVREGEKLELAKVPPVHGVVSDGMVQTLIRIEFDDKMPLRSIPDDRVRTYFDAHPDQFVRPEMRRAAHVQVATKEAADELVRSLRDADQAAFREAARQKSVDTETNQRGGDLGFFPRQARAKNAPGQAPDVQIDLQLREVAFALREIGDVSEPVRIGTNWSVVKLTGIRAAESRSYESAAQTIRLQLWREHRQQAIDAFVDRLRTNFAPTVTEELVAKVKLDPIDPAKIRDPHHER